MYKKIVLLVVILSSFNLFAVNNRVSEKLVGKVDYTYYFFDVYEAKLWSDSIEPLYGSPLTLELIYKRDFEGSDIVEETKRQFDHQGVAPSVYKTWKKKLLEIFPDIKKGDRIFANYDPKKGLIFYLNNEKVLGEIKDLEFCRIFMDIWLGKKSSSKKLRNGLLGIK